MINLTRLCTGRAQPADNLRHGHGRCAACQWFKLCGGGFRTRAAFANGDLWGRDPGCYLSEEEIGVELAAC